MQVGGGEWQGAACCLAPGQPASQAEKARQQAVGLPAAAAAAAAAAVVHLRACCLHARLARSATAHVCPALSTCRAGGPQLQRAQHRH